MKRTFWGVIILLLGVVFLTGCGEDNGSGVSSNASNSNKE